MKNKNGLMSYEQLKELLQMTALQTSENAKQIGEHGRTLKEMRKEFRDELRASAKLHDREMKEIRFELKKMIRRIAS